MKTELVCIIDKSGSMHAIWGDAIGGFNTFLREQQALPGEASFSLVLFDDRVMTVMENTPLDQVSPLSVDQYRPGGCTALLDALGFTIDSVGQRLAAMPEDARPDKVIVSILTDGQENASTKHHLHSVRTRIEHQREVYKWEFVFLGANVDSIFEAQNLGIPQDNAFNYQATNSGVRDAYQTLSAVNTRLRSNG